MSYIIFSLRCSDCDKDIFTSYQQYEPDLLDSGFEINKRWMQRAIREDKLEEHKCLRN